MKTLPEIFENNSRWAEENVKADADYYINMAKGQAPKHLWIGCADSRVPANEVTGLEPGELFVHRNIANMVVHTDLSMLSVLQYAVEHLKVEHVIVCGHYGCGGVAAAYSNGRFGLIDHWLKHIQDVAHGCKEELETLPEEERVNRLCELNVLAQAHNLTRTTVVQDAWGRDQKLEIHSWIYGLDTGKLTCLQDPIAGPEV